MPLRKTITWSIAVGCSLAAGLSTASAAPRPDGEVRIEVVDKATGQPIPARMHLSAGKQIAPAAAARTRPKRPVKLNLPGSAEFGGHFYIDGAVTLPLKAGPYTFELEATPEYLNQSGGFDIQRHADDAKRIEMRRFVDLEKEGWYGGDLDVYRDAKVLPLIMRAEGLRIVPNVDASKTPDDLPLEVSGHRIARTPYAWNLPVWLSKNELDAISLIHRQSLRDAAVDNEDDGRARDKTFFPGPHGNGRWSEAIYYHALNCGLRIPPVAGSGSGANDSPVGTNRVYVHCDGEFSPTAWWEGLKAGRVFVTNGPLLRPLVEGQPPGYVFHTEKGQMLSLEIGLNLATRVPVEYLQIVKNGAVAAEVRLADWKDKKGKLPPVEFNASGWFLVRAVTSNPRVHQFASSGPYYVEQAGQTRISRKSVQFFLDWIEAAEARLRKLPGLDEAKLETQLAEQATARKYFEALLAKANAD